MDARTAKLLWLLIGCLLSGLSGSALLTFGKVIRLPRQPFWKPLWQSMHDNLPAYLLIFLSFAMGLTVIGMALFNRRPSPQSDPSKNID